MSTAGPLLELGQVVKSYGEHDALRGVDVTVHRGEFVALLGPNGAGKTTLFNILSGLISQDSGRVSINGRSNDDAGSRHGLGFVFQQLTLDLDLSVRANLRFHAALYGMSGRHIDNRIEAELSRSGLTGGQRRYCRELSGGNRRKVELARALLHEPELLLMDEATAGLDHASRRGLVEEVRRLVGRRGVGVLWATHLVDEAAEADRIIVLHEGKVLCDGPPAELLARTGESTLGAAFLALTARSPSPEPAI